MVDYLSWRETRTFENLDEKASTLDVYWLEEFEDDEMWDYEGWDFLNEEVDPEERKEKANHKEIEGL